VAIKVVAKPHGKLFEKIK